MIIDDGYANCQTPNLKLCTVCYNVQLASYNRYYFLYDICLWFYYLHGPDVIFFMTQQTSVIHAYTYTGVEIL